MSRLAVSLSLACLAALAAAPAATAQWDPAASAMLGQGYGQNALSQSVMTNTFNSTGGSGGSGKTESKKPKPPRKPTKRQLATLRFTPTAQRTQANAAEISQILLASCPPDREGCPLDHAGIIAQGLNTGDHWTRYTDNVRTVVRGSERNLADAVSTFVILAWLAQRPTLDLTAAQKQGARRVGADLRNQMALSAPIRRLSETRKQRLAETLGSIAQHTLALRHAYTRIQRPEEAEKLTRYLRDVTEELASVDVAQLRLTRTGFARR
jgi:hypothetical protein